MKYILCRNDTQLQNYLFDCECMKCEAQKNDPDVTSDEEGDSEEEMECS